MKSDPKIHCIALCKNEADIVGVCLRAAAKWASFIYVYDGGSTDGTWEIVKSLNCPQVIAWRQDSKVFREGLRAEVFNEFRHLAKNGDWWLQLNVDELYLESPKVFLDRVPKGHDFVWGTMAEYVLTELDIASLDFTLPFSEIMPQLRYYYVAWSEGRAFRHRDRLVWDPACAWPRHVGLVAKERIVYKHYPCRSPKQLQLRSETRRQNRERGFEGWKECHEAWRQAVKNSKDFLYDDGINPLKINEADLPRHLEKPYVRIMKHVLHKTGIWP